MRRTWVDLKIMLSALRLSTARAWIRWSVASSLRAADHRLAEQSRRLLCCCQGRLALSAGRGRSLSSALPALVFKISFMFRGLFFRCPVRALCREQRDGRRFPDRERRSVRDAVASTGNEDVGRTMRCALVSRFQKWRGECGVFADVYENTSPGRPTIEKLIGDQPLRRRSEWVLLSKTSVP